MKNTWSFVSGSPKGNATGVSIANATHAAMPPGMQYAPYSVDQRDGSVRFFFGDAIVDSSGTDAIVDTMWKLDGVTKMDMSRVPLLHAPRPARGRKRP